MYDILTRICAGEGQEGDLERLEEIALAVKASSLCGLGQTAPNPVLSTIRHFREEYEEHIRQKHCRASVCEALVESPCSHACPAGVNVPQYLALIAENRLDDAVNLIHRRNPFVSVCGRVCDAPCERRCRRADVDEPLAIRALKRYAADNASELIKPLSAPARGKAQVAIVGGGPAGLSCAYFLGLLGRRSLIFEALPIPGGMLSVGIPEYRLPKANLQADIDFILSHGAELRTGSPIDDVASLAAGFKAVFVATGAHTGRPLGVEGEDLAGVVDSLLFLRGRALGQKVPCGKQVAVIGGGNAAIDTARSALRLGASRVLILYRRTREEMPAYEEEIQAALEEGAELQQLVAPVGIFGRDGKVTGIRMIRMRLGDADESGRRRPVAVPGSEFVVECDMVLPAIGQRPSTVAVRSVAKMNRVEGIEADPLTGATSAAGVFAGGDCVTGGATVIEAIRAGQRAAVAIDRQLGGSGVLPANVGMSLRRPSEEELERLLPRAAEPWLALEERKKSFVEVVCGLKPDEACYEAGRCLRCDLERAESLQARRGV
jgi:NADH-quinone oxidoreductase subunit F